MSRLTFAVAIGGRIRVGDHAHLSHILVMIMHIFSICDQNGTMRPILMFRELPKNIQLTGTIAKLLY